MTLSISPYEMDDAPQANGLDPRATLICRNYATAGLPPARTAGRRNSAGGSVSDREGSGSARQVRLIAIDTG
jgi:hypothetical protein